MSEHFQVIVIGAGPGGYIAALKAAQLGAKVAVVEKHHVGGTCLNYGCIPSKALLASAELIHHARNAAALGVQIGGPITPDWTKIQSRKDRILATQRSGIKALFAGRKVTLFDGRAKLNGLGKVEVQGSAGPVQEITADKMILATGSVPSWLPGLPSDREKVCTSDEALHWKTLPAKLLVLGGGVIGCELACAMQAFGVEVTIVEMLPRLLPPLDGQISKGIEKTLTARGIKCLTGRKVEQVSLTDTGVTARLESNETLAADRLLVATGRKPNTAEMGLESVGLATERGFLRVNDEMETPVKGYYCVGDANGRCLLAHAASAQGITAAENALHGGKTLSAPVPNCVYTFPEAASVGLTTEEAVAQEIPHFAGNFPLRFLGKAQACGELEGFVRVIKHRETGQLLGVHMLGHNATECIAAAGALLHQKVTVEQMAEVIFAHPTISEGIKEAAEDALHAGLHVLPRPVQQVKAGIIAAPGN